MTQTAWTVEAIGALNHVGSWTGRTHLQKLMFLAESLCGINTPFCFVLYQYGPYSVQLDLMARDLEVFGLIRKQFRGGQEYGGSLVVTDEGRDAVAGKLSDDDKSILARVAKLIGSNGVKELELIATCCWTERMLGANSDDAIIEEVARIKPKYSREEICEQLAEYRRVQHELGA